MKLGLTYPNKIAPLLLSAATRRAAPKQRGRLRWFFTRQLRTRDQAGKPDRIGVLQISVDGSDDDAGLDRDQVNAHERDPHPGVNDDPFVQDAIENIDKAGSAGYTLNGPRSAPTPLYAPSERGIL